MSDDIAIRVENLSKLYHIGRARERHDTLRDAVVDTLHRLTFQRSNVQRTDEEHIWALKDVSFEVKRGEVVGVIGRNGAGKSTLLKILSRITEPTSGRAEIHGRVGSLLEVGTGFHPELTGRENVYLSGAILGMRRAEIDCKFDKIVDFSGVEKFMDTPFKRYSSGMRVRLGFAVAAHLDPEILLIDEVLAVGDAAFQRKCLGKMGEVAGEGRTVVFVSHNMAAIENLTNRAIYLDDGTVVDIGGSEEVVSKYLKLFVDEDVPENSVDLTQMQPVKQRGIQVLKTLEIISNGHLTTSVKMGDEIAFYITYSTPKPIQQPRVGIGIESEKGENIVVFGMPIAGAQLSKLSGSGRIICRVGRLPLNQGTYYLKLVLGQLHEKHFEVYERVCKFHILPSDVFSSGKVPDPKWGFLVWSSEWCVEEV
jgi:lipopolysaccharide transport system ATP-binding protein